MQSSSWLRRTHSVLGAAAAPAAARVAPGLPVRRGLSLSAAAAPAAPAPAGGPGGVSDTYMRALPPSCTDWSSDRGRALFREALAAGGAEAFFPLAAQFATQAEPANCGPGSLSMVLNALNVDPGRVWKGIWRWYDERQLASCVPPAALAASGISLDTFACLARCNGAAATVTRAGAPGGPGGLAAFRAAVAAAAARREGAFLVAAYDRAGLGQTGGGHFSPLAAYHAAEDAVLILDVARFKYPPHWVPVPALHAAMTAQDAQTGRARGWAVVARSAAVPLVLHALGGGLAAAPTPAGATATATATATASPATPATAPPAPPPLQPLPPGQCCTGAGAGIAAAGAALSEVRAALDGGPAEPAATGEHAAYAAAVRELARAAAARAGGGPPGALDAGGALTLSEEAACLSRLSRQQVAAAAALVGELERLPVFAAVARAVDGGAGGGGRGGAPPLAAPRAAAPAAGGEPSDARLCGVHGPDECVRVQPSHILTTLLLAMYAGPEGGAGGEGGAGAGARGHGAVLRAAVAASLAGASPLVRSEVSLLAGQVAP